MTLIILAHKSQGVAFAGRPEYIQQDAYLDPSGGLTIHKDVVISTKVIVLTHDWSFLKRAKYLGGKRLALLGLWWSGKTASSAPAPSCCQAQPLAKIA